MKTLGIKLITTRFVLPNTVITSFEADVSDISAISTCINYCQTDVSGDQSTSPTFIIEGYCSGFWDTLYTWQPAQAVPTREALTASVHTGTKTLTFNDIPSEWNMGAQYFLHHEFVANPTNIVRSEFVIVNSKTSTTVELVDPTEFMHPVNAATNIYLYNLADTWIYQIDTTAHVKLRLLIDAGLSDKEFVVSANASQLDAT